jgi:hypothetical protein
MQEVGVDGERGLAALVLGDRDLVLLATASAPTFSAISICFLAISGRAMEVPSR